MEKAGGEMNLKIKLHPNSSQEKIKMLKENEYEIWIKEKPVDNKANTKLINLLKKHFKKDVKIKSGLKGRNKIVEMG